MKIYLCANKYIIMNDRIYYDYFTVALVFSYFCTVSC